MTTKTKRLSPIPFEAQQAQSEWLLEQFDKGIAPNGHSECQGTNYPGHPNYNQPFKALPQNVWTPRVARQPPPPIPTRSDRFSIAVPSYEFADYTRADQTVVTNYDRIEVSAYRIDADGFDAVRWETRYRGRVYSYTVSAQVIEQAPARELRNIVTHELLRRIARDVERTRTQIPIRDEDGF